MSLIFERGGRESKSPTTSSTKEHTLYSFPGNYTTNDNPNFDVGGHFTFKDSKDKVIFSVCGGDPFNGTPPKNVSKDDLLHSYIINIYAEGSITLQISHQPNAITGPLDIRAKVSLFSMNKVIGIRVIGIYSDSQNCRNLYVLMDESNTDHWKVVTSFNDRGQYIPLVFQRIKGMFKSGPPYRDYPYGDNNAITDIHVYGSAEASDTWCRQININNKLWSDELNEISLEEDDLEPVVTTTEMLGISLAETEMMNLLMSSKKEVTKAICTLCGSNMGIILGIKKGTPLCIECYSRIEGNIRKIKSSEVRT